MAYRGTKVDFWILSGKIGYLNYGITPFLQIHKKHA